MQVVVLGAGAVGGVIAGSLAAAGRPVTLVDPWYRHVETIRHRGLEVETLEGGFVAAPSVKHLDEIAELAAIDVLVIALKAYDTPWAARLLEPFVTADGVVLSAQNGMNEAQLAAVFGEQRVMGCVVSMGAECFEAGQVRRTTEHTRGLIIGELDGVNSARVTALCDTLGPVGAEVSPRIVTELWGKLVLNVMSNAVGGLTGRATSTLWTEDDGIVDCIVALGHEAAVVAEQAGIKIAPVLRSIPHEQFSKAERRSDVSWRTIREQLRAAASGRTGARENRPSLLQDVLKQRRTEVDYLNGWIVAQGAALGVDAPMNRTVVELVHELELDGGEPGDGRLAALLGVLEERHG